ncbi:hypothetical protein CRE_08660 [Caenorhabditis remanei]|uniref:C-type lectin domain-containing protein n=1 Tax=Caenorhabditis remanei TaxID=31234 RepID=E3LJ84_CAERE|nr:hypothetical protein CRE_08660 [Caenorhabditis remanei]
MITTTASNIITETTNFKVKTTTTSTRTPFKATSTTLKPTTTATPQNLTCTNDFTMVHGKCWRWFNENSTRADADQKCKWHNGATLVSIRNYEENQALADFIKEKNIDSLWIGLYCTEWTNIDSCIWDIQAGSAANYSSFGEGYPNADIGKCVYYTGRGNNTGKWINTLCNQNMTYVYSTCDFNYNSHCYSPFPYRKYVTDAQNFCVSRCSNLVSIHSANENRFIQSMYPDVPYMYTMIGALAPSLDYIIWIDGSESDYNNMRQTTESPRGSCVAMATGSVDTGYWFVFPCTEYWYYTLLCKRPAGIKC